METTHDFDEGLEMPETDTGTDTGTDYIELPVSNRNNLNITDPLVSKLKKKIESDIIQLNGIYDMEIKTAEKELEIEIKYIRDRYSEMISNINKRRAKEREEYTKRAEKQIENLLGTDDQSLSKNNRISDFYNMIKAFIFPV
jgi:hypothetical protein